MSAAGLSALLRSSNTVFLGEAGCGKSELAVHLALELAEQGKAVHFFDLDQTKPLMRSRDAEALLADAGAAVHFEQQRADAHRPAQLVAADSGQIYPQRGHGVRQLQKALQEQGVVLHRADLAE